jgi:hypothetical protein
VIKLLPLLLVACASIPDGATPLSAADYRDALQVWQQAGQPLGRCNAYSDDGSVLVLIVDDTMERCYADVNGCLTSVSPGIMGSGGYYPIVVQQRSHAGDRLLAHELTHWFMRCGLKRRDDLHKTPGVWDSAQGPGVESDIAEAVGKP